MKLFRTELTQGFTDRLFDIPVEDIDAKDIRFTGDTIPCVLSVLPEAGGFKINGHLTIDFQETCDRCLDEFEDSHQADFVLWLSGDETITSADETIIYFPETQETIEMNPALRDIVLVEFPMKHLCREDCKGLCSRCGKNLNKDICDCEPFQEDNPWSALKKLTG